ncbi:MAG: histidine kinase N-terminal 7TM domain-containing protein, partial [bacterium]
MEFSIGLVSLLIWLTAVTLASLGIVVLLGNSSKGPRVFFVLSCAVSLWLISHGFYHAANYEAALYFIKGNYFFGGVLAAVFFYFALVFPEGKKQKWWVIPALIISQIILFAIYAYTNSIVYGAEFIGGFQQWAWHYGSLGILFDFFFYLYWGGGLLIIFKKFWHTDKENPKRLQLKAMLIAMIIAISPTSVMNILLPKLGYFSLDWLGAITVLAFISVMAYSIMEYNQMDVKAVAAEVLVLVMVIVLFANIFTEGVLFGLWGRLTIFTVFAFIGVYFIKSILREARQKEELSHLNLKLTDLNLHLEDKVREQTAEIRKAYEVEKKARHDLEALDIAKTDFMLTTQHHLRTPLTIVKAVANMLVGKKEGDVYTKTDTAFIEKL